MSEELKVEAEIPATIYDLATHSAKENSRYAINGVLVEKEEDRLSVVATDGRRLAVLDTKSGESEDFSVIVSLEALSLKPKPAEPTVTLYVYESEVRITHSKGEKTGSIVEGNFPSYREIIPEHTANDSVETPAIQANPVLVSDAAALVHRHNRRRGYSDGDPEEGGIQIAYRKPNKPMVMKSGPEDDRITIVIMPLEMEAIK